VDLSSGLRLGSDKSGLEPSAIAALRAAGWDHVVVVGGDVRPTAVVGA
jgi:hypothetical protein